VRVLAHIGYHADSVRGELEELIVREERNGNRRGLQTVREGRRDRVASNGETMRMTGLDLGAFGWQV
jgi:hypothetical protein